jgi:uncharacterized protein (DUF362 family)
MVIPSRSIPRRTFVRRATAGLAAVPFMGFPDVEPIRRVRQVALVRTRDRRHGVSEALRLLGAAGVDGRHVVVKPNFNSADATPGSTHNDVLAGIVREMHERGARAVTVGESSGPSNTRSIMERKGIFDLAEDEQFDVVNFDEMPESDWLPFGATGTHWPEGFHLPRAVVNAEYLVSTCCLKTHGYGGVFTMSLKLSVGLTPKPIRRGMHRSPDMRRMIAELNSAYTPQLIVLDGVDAFTDGGPSDGELKQGNVIIAGNDRVAIDAVGLAVLKELGSNDAIMSRLRVRSSSGSVRADRPTSGS